MANPKSSQPSGTVELGGTCRHNEDDADSHDDFDGDINGGDDHNDHDGTPMRRCMCMDAYGWRVLS